MVFIYILIFIFGVGVGIFNAGILKDGSYVDQLQDAYDQGYAKGLEDSNKER